MLSLTSLSIQGLNLAPIALTSFVEDLVGSLFTFFCILLRTLVVLNLSDLRYSAFFTLHYIHLVLIVLNQLCYDGLDCVPVAGGP